MSEQYSTLADEDLIVRALNADPDTRQQLLGVLYERHYRSVARWCLRMGGNVDLAADLAQDVFVRVHEKLHTFRGESGFRTWLYTVARSVSINRGLATNRHRNAVADEDRLARTADEQPGAEERLQRAQIAERLRDAMRRDLEPLEAKILYLHFVQGWSLPMITERLELQNRSGAKAYIVSAKRKLKRKFGRWFQAQSNTRRSA